jgi:dTDP-4-amino-4,6-dideoxygalactose transaminase
MTEPSHGPWYYQQLELGLNYRMTDIQAALGLSQLKHLDNWVARRHWVADRYDELLAHMPVSLPYRSSDSRSSFHLYSILVDNRQFVFDQMRYSGVGVNVHYIPVHLQPYYQSYLGTRRDLTSSESYYARAMSLPMFASLTEQQINHTVESLRKALC